MLFPARNLNAPFRVGLDLIESDKWTVRTLSKVTSGHEARDCARIEISTGLLYTVVTTRRECVENSIIGTKLFTRQSRHYQPVSIDAKMQYRAYLSVMQACDGGGRSCALYVDQVHHKPRPFDGRS